ncbi:MAG: class I SAM-dependent methyltransferase [Pseudonocardiaceae bacterium]
MRYSEQPAGDPPVEAQVEFWNRWNREAREERPPDRPTLRRQQEVLAALQRAGIRSARILEVGCGTGWLSARLLDHGEVTATDLAGQIVERARCSFPDVHFLTGDFMTLDAGTGYDVVVCLETLSHVVDQRAFVARLASCLRPGGMLVLTTQNRFVLERRDDVMPPGPGQVRRWLNRRELASLMAPDFRILRLASLEPAGHGGVLRLVNSSKLTRPLVAVLGRDRMRRWKEAAGLGQTRLVVAEKQRTA